MNHDGSLDCLELAQLRTILTHMTRDVDPRILKLNDLYRYQAQQESLLAVKRAYGAASAAREIEAGKSFDIWTTEMLRRHS